MASDIEDCIEFFGSANEIGEFLCFLPQGLLAIKKVGGCFVGLEHFNRGWVEGSFATCRRGHSDVGVRC